VPVDALPQEYTIMAVLASNHGTLPLAPLNQQPVSPLPLARTKIERGAVPQVKPDLEVRYPLKSQFGNVHLLGSDAAGEVGVGGVWRLILFWQADSQISANYKLKLIATTENGEEIAGHEEVLLKGVYPTKQWRAGDYVRSVHDLQIPEGAPHGKAIVRVSLLTPEGEPVGRADGAPIAGIDIAGRARVFQEPNPASPRVAQFGDAIRLVGFDLPTTRLKAGEPMSIVLYWQALGTADKPYTVFAHLLDVNGQLIGQRDAQPQDGQAPTDAWQKGEYLTDPYTFEIAPDAPIGAAALEIGFYESTTGARLPVKDETGNPLGDRLLLEGLTIE
jgi:hypothetical protein